LDLQLIITYSGLQNTPALVTINPMAKVFAGIYILVSAAVLAYLLSPPIAEARSSPNYRFEETSLGGSGFLNAQSNNYQATGTSGILGLGDSAGSGYQLSNGHVTTPDPTLSFIVNDFDIAFPEFSPSVAATTTATFQVINDTGYGYIVQIYGTPPTYGSHTLAPMGTTAPEPSQVGIEQFGINLVANTSPVSVGANPVNDENVQYGKQFGFGQESANYDTANNYRFVSGDTIAEAPKSSGKTTYTISYLVNVDNLTPGGKSTSNQPIICIGTY
jgi:hypothetical protein